MQEPLDRLCHWRNRKANITSRDRSRRKGMSGEKANRRWKGKFRS